MNVPFRRSWQIVLLVGVAFCGGRLTQQDILKLLATQSNSRVDKSSNAISPHHDAKLPNWRMTTDCSAYSRDCVLRKLNEQKYEEYPFRFAEKFEERYEWQDKLPATWRESLREHIPRDTPKSARNRTAAIMECVRKAQTKSVEEQLDQLLASLKPVAEIDMVSFTISDYLYARDMMQDVFEMAANVAGFKNAFFMVAMDLPTMELACQHDYPFLAWPQEGTSVPESGTSLKANVANTKFEISHALSKRRQSFLFFEMDIWWVQSPISVLEEQTEDILFSGHQDNPEAANIGVYSVLGNEASEEYMRICIDIMKQSPDTHDQVIMQQVGYLLNQLEDGQPLQYGGPLEGKDPPLQLPTFQHPAKHGRFVPYLIATNVRPVTTEHTLAIHTLCRAPLRNPHGKKMVAKELAAWYGSAGYYAGKDNRYLWLDGHVWNGFSVAISWPGYHPWASYHDIRVLHWIVAATIALSRRTGRIWVMPKILNAYDIHFLWTVLDMESVEAQVDVRETNFPVNPKAWHNSSVPFDPVARTALGDRGKIFAQLNAADTAAGSNGNILAWKPETYEKSEGPFDAWFAIHTTIPELVRAQVLLAGLPVGTSLINTLQAKVVGKEKLTAAETEIFDVWKNLRWCEEEFDRHEHTAGRAEAEWDCYGQGKMSEWQKQAGVATERA